MSSETLVSNRDVSAARVNHVMNYKYEVFKIKRIWQNLVGARMRMKNPFSDERHEVGKENGKYEGIRKSHKNKLD